MAKYKPYSYNQSKLIPLYFDDQLIPGTFEAALNHIVDCELDLSIFLDRYKNDLCGAPAYDPAILLKIVLFAYSHGITSSRKIAWCCRHNILFKALSADTVPHFTTIADFISTMEAEITPLFRNVLLICDEMGLIGKSGKPLKQNLTDPDSAKMATSHGVIQGYNGIAAADAKHQVIVGAEASGSGSEQDLLLPMIDQTEAHLKAIGQAAPRSKATKVLADSGFHSEANMKKMEEKDIDGYIADKRYRQRDPRFATAGRHKAPEKKAKYFKPADFRRDEKTGKVTCPAGKPLHIKNSNFAVKGKAGITYRARQSDCGPCPLRSKCLRLTTTKARQVTFFTGKTKSGKTTHTQKMIRKMDTPRGREIYSLRMGLIEPVFANIRSTMGLDRFSLRGKTKVNIQWLLFCITHNLGKIQKYGKIRKDGLKAA